MAQSVKVFLHKHEDLSSTPGPYIKKRRIFVTSVLVMGGLLGLEDPVSIGKMGDDPELGHTETLPQQQQGEPERWLSG